MHRSVILVRPFLFILVLLLLAGPALAGKAKKQREAVEQLPVQYQEWLEGVTYIISEEEIALFLELGKDYQRDAFIERFWQVRDQYPRTVRNEYKEDYEARIEIVREEFGKIARDERAKVLLLNGMPAARLELDCRPEMVPLEVWHYAGSDTYAMEFLLLFFRRFGRGEFELWEPLDGIEVLFQAVTAAQFTSIDRACGTQKAEPILAAIGFMRAQGGQFGAISFLARLLEPPPVPKKEWVATFSTYSTDLPAGAETFEATLDLSFPGRNQSRTVVQGALAVDLEDLSRAEISNYASYNLMLNGEVLRGEKLFDHFRYKYDFPVAEIEGERIPLVFQRYLRPGDYQLILKLEDINSGHFHRTERPLSVPEVESAPPPEPDDPETARILAEANAAIRSGESTIQIAPLSGEWQTGLVRIDALTTGNAFDQVTFWVDGTPILTKKRPPFNVELDLGQVPVAKTLRVVGYDAGGEELASDEILLNAGRHRFAVRLTEPRQGKTYRRSLRAQADIIVPETEVVERVEFYLNETLIAAVYQPPYIQPIILPESEVIAYVRAVAYTPDGNSVEDVVFINAPDYVENVDVDLVELYTAVLDRQDHPVQGLTQEDFTIFEDGVEQQVVRFELVKNLPIRAAVVLDVSASMEEELDETRQAALHFFQQAVTPRDRAALITFNDHPHLAASFTHDVDVLAGGLAGLKAERGTALFDSMIFSLYYFNGVKGQRAILLLSDGKDESSRFEWDDALEYAHRAGVAIYAIGLKIPGRQDDARRKLKKLAEETGGRSFFIEDVSELKSIYEAIQVELRSRYLLAYQSSNTSGDRRFRSIDVKMARSGQEAKTLRGYYP